MTEFKQSVASALSQVNSFELDKRSGTPVVAQFGGNKKPWWIWSQEEKNQKAANNQVLSALAKIMAADGFSIDADHRTVTFNKAIADMTFDNVSQPSLAMSDLYAIYGLARGAVLKSGRSVAALVEAYRTACKPNKGSAALSCISGSDPENIDDHAGPLLAAVPKKWFGTDRFTFDLADGGVAGVDKPIIGSWLSFEPQFSSGILQLCLAILQEDEGMVFGALGDFFSSQWNVGNSPFGHLFPSQWGTANFGVVFVPAVTSKRSAVAIATLMSMGIYCFGFKPADYSLVDSLKSFGVVPFTFVKVGKNYGCLELLPYVASNNISRFIDFVSMRIGVKDEGQLHSQQWAEGFDEFAFKASLIPARSIERRVVGCLLLYCVYRSNNSYGGICMPNGPFNSVRLMGDDFADLDHADFADIFDLAEEIWEGKNG